MTRTFDDRPAKREQVPLVVGVSGPSGSGKSMSALRIATGIQRVSGSDIFCVDTEARRLLHYADKFKFRHLEFKAPFGPLDYLAAIEHCYNKGARIIVVDSFSNEHEGVGGVLEIHESEVQRLCRGDDSKAERVKMLAWGKPKQERRRLINTILQMNCNFVFCTRAREKLRLDPGRPPVALGWMPVSAEELIYECTVHAMLPPGSNGVPQWRPVLPGEQLVTKLPEQFRPLLADGRQLDEDIGERLARWAAGEVSSAAVAKQGATTADAPEPKFSDRLPWAGKDAWAGKPLSDAPPGDLELYLEAIVAAAAKTRPEKAGPLKAHMSHVEVALSAARQ